MEEREFFNETEYIEGFNLGYKMTRNFPELAEFLDYTRGNNDKLDGLKDGRQQYLEEQLQEKTLDKDKQTDTPNWLKNDRFDNLDKDKSKDIEPDL